MKSLREILRDADPFPGEPPLDSSDVDRMRRVVLAERRDPRPSWTRPALVAAAAAIVVAAVADRWPASGRSTKDMPAQVDAPIDAAARRQLQFVTPGGTRVIWTFNSTLDMR